MVGMVIWQLDEQENEQVDEWEISEQNELVILLDEEETSLVEWICWIPFL